MQPKFLLLLATLISATAATLIIRDFLIPRARGSRNKLLQSLVIIHAFRFVGLGMFIPGIAAGLPPEFSIPAAGGDYIAAVLALCAYVLLGRESKAGPAATWFFNLWGFLDLVMVVVLAAVYQISNTMGSMFFVFVVYPPWLIVSHIVVFKVLLRKR